MIPYEGPLAKKKKNNSIDCFECGEITFSEFYTFYANDFLTSQTRVMTHNVRFGILICSLIYAHFM